MAPKTLNNKVNQLAWNIPITNPNGTPTDEFQRKWLQQAATNASIVDLTTANAVSAVLDLISAAPGSLLERSAFTWGGLASPNNATKFLNGAAFPAYAQVKDSDLSLSDIVTNNASTARHGFVPKLPNDATKFYDGLGNFSTPPGGGTFAASIYDDGTTIYLAVVDSDEQLVVDGAGLGVYVPEIFPPAALPLASSSAFGAVKVDNFSIGAVAGVIGTLFEGFVAQKTANQAVVDSTYTKATYNSFVTNTLGTQLVLATGIFTPTKAGKYLVFASFLGQVATVMSNVNALINKNGTFPAGSIVGSGSTAGIPSSALSGTAFALTIVDMNGSTDTLEIDALVTGTGGSDVLFGGACFFGAVYIGT